MLDTVELSRRLENVVMLGTIAEVDHAAARCRVAAGDLLTAPVPWIAQRAGDARTWWAPSVGEQVLLLSPGGNPARGVVLPAVYATAHPAPSEQGDTSHLAIYPDGAVIFYDPQSHVLSVTLPVGGKVQVAAPGGVEVTGDVRITGKLSVSDNVDVGGGVTVTDDVVAGTVSLRHHLTTNVQPGSGLSGEPQP